MRSQPALLANTPTSLVRPLPSLKRRPMQVVVRTI